MFEISFKFAYLILLAPFGLWWVGFYIFSSNTRVLQLKASVAGAIVGPLSEILYFQDYWNPESIASFQIASFPLMIEDILFGFFFVGTVSVVTFSVLRAKRIHSARSNKTTLIYTLSSIIFFWLLFLSLDLNSIYASTLALYTTSIALLFFSKEKILKQALLSATLTSAILFVSYLFVYHVIVSNTEEILSTGWLLYGTNLDVRVLSIPLTEIIWATSVGFFLYCYSVVGLKIVFSNHD